MLNAKCELLAINLVKKISNWFKKYAWNTKAWQIKSFSNLLASIVFSYKCEGIFSYK